jgi:hypothetical protein
MGTVSEVLSAIGTARGAIELNCSYEFVMTCLAMSPQDSLATATTTPTQAQNVIRRPRSQESAWYSSLFPAHGNASSFAGESAMAVVTYKHCECSARQWPWAIYPSDDPSSDRSPPQAAPRTVSYCFTIRRRLASLDGIVAGAAQRGRANTAASIMADQKKTRAALVTD